MSDLDHMNEAGEHLCMMYKWNWLKRAPVTLGIVAGQEYVALPVDCAAILGLIPTDSASMSVDMVDVSLVLQARQYGFNGSSMYVAGFTYAGTPPAPRLEINPTPTTADSNAWTLYYRGGWILLGTQDDILPIPLWMKPLYDQVLMSVVKGWKEHDNASLSVRLAEVQAGPIYRNCVRRDRGMQSAKGQLGGRGWGGPANINTDWLDSIGPVVGP